jgi:FkbM family methyltransferase
MTKKGFLKNKYLDFYLFSGYSKKDYMHKKYNNNGGTFDSNISEWIINNVKPGWVIYDIGANMFEITELSARMSGQSGSVFSFEPQVDLVNKYKDAKKLNNYDNVASINIYNFGLGSLNELKTFMINPSNLGASTFQEKFVEYAKDIENISYSKKLQLEVKRLDSINLPKIVPDLLKIDIEGGEEDFWIGCPDFIKLSKNIIVEVGEYTEYWFIKELSYNRKIFDISTKEELHIDNVIGKYQKDILFTKTVF